MTDLESKAATARSFVRAIESTGAYRLESTELVGADEITESGTFPKFGDWVEVTTLGRDGSEHEEAMLEVPAALAAELVAIGIEAGDQFVIESAKKNGDEALEFSVVKPTDAENFMG